MLKSLYLTKYIGCGFMGGMNIPILTPAPEGRNFSRVS